MKLTNYTDFSLRVLIYLASRENNELSNIQQIADVYGISKNHLTKVIYHLGKTRVCGNDSRKKWRDQAWKSPESINIERLSVIQRMI